MQFGGDGVAVCIIKINSRFKCTGVLDSHSSPSRSRMQRDVTENRHVDMWINRRRSYSGGGRFEVCES